MTKLRLKYVDRFVDRTGCTRYYFRRGRGPRITLPGLPGSAEFMAAYQAALNGKPSRPKSDREGTFDQLLELYFKSSKYAKLKPSTRRAYRLSMERLVKLEGLGHRKVADMKPKHVDAIVARRADTPAAANKARKNLHVLLSFAIKLEWRTTDPTVGVDRLREGTHHTWTDAEIEQFEARWPVGTLERTAFALLLYTGQRVGDVAAIRWSDMDATGINFVQQKTGTALHVPIHEDLRDALSQWPRQHVMVLTTAYGAAFTTKGFGNKMADAIERAGLPDRCRAHGLRKAAARRLAEYGCSANEIASITGHASLAEVSRYTRAADQRRLGPAAIAKLPTSTPKRKSQTQSPEE